MTKCDVCDRKVEQPRRGYRLRHRECASLHEDVQRLRIHIDAIRAGTHPAALSGRVLAQLRYDLFCLTADLPRTRDSAGRFVSSHLSETYDATAERRRSWRDLARAALAFMARETT